MNANPFKRGLDERRLQLGTWVMMVRTPAILTLLKSVGLDYARLDMEHSPVSLETVSDMAVLARALDFGLCVRLPVGRREWISRALDAGVRNLYVPQVHNAEMAQEIVNAARYAPMGNRGTFEPGPQNDYQDDPQDLPVLDEQVHITVMLESKQAFDNIDEIASVPGIDTLAIGPADLAQELGIYGASDEEQRIDEYKLQIHEAALRADKTFEMGARSASDAKRWIKAGAHVLTYLTETNVLRSAFADAARLRDELTRST
jgi:2-dehydro-3-deoxyglucarate aldolase/4-hydroxy-2-oxoheptanedioate aldolase